MKHPVARKVLRPAIALALGLSLALTPVASVPALAGDQRAEQNVIAALIALGIIGLAIESSKNGQVTHEPPRQPDRSRVLPSRCLRTFDTPRGDRDFFGKICLRRNFDNFRRLPEQCERTIRVYNRDGDLRRRNVYGPRCLRDHGYRMAGRRY